MPSKELASPEEVEAFVTAVRLRSRIQEDDYRGATLKQIVKLVIQIDRALVNKKNRKRVLQAITGLPIKSQKELAGCIQSVLIDETLDGKSDSVLRGIEADLENASGIQAIDLYPWYRPGSAVPDMSGSDSGDQWGLARGFDYEGPDPKPDESGANL